MISRLEIKNLSLAYDGAAVVENLSFSVEKGQYLCIVGENGSGKSTLLKSILGLIRPIEGEIVFSGDFGRKNIGYLPQQQSSQRDFPASVKEVILSAFAGKTSLPFVTAGMKKKAAETAKQLNTFELFDRPFCELSGGQQQRVLLTRALCATDSLLLLDEPINGLDPKAAADMYAQIKALHEKGMTVIMITHDIESANKNADLILELSHKGYFFGTAEQYKSR